MQDFAIPFTKVRSQPTPLCRNQNVKSYKVLQLARAWDPAKAVKLRLPSWVDELAHILPISSWNLIPRVIPALRQELPAYMALAANATFDRSDIKVYTEQVLSWWRNNEQKIPT